MSEPTFSKWSALKVILRMVQDSTAMAPSDQKDALAPIIRQAQEALNELESSLPAPVVAEVRRAPLDPVDLHFKDPRLLARTIVELNSEVARLTAERDERAEGTDRIKGLLMRAYQHNAAAYDERDKAKSDLEALRTRLRGLEQQWRHDQIDWVDPRTKCAEELAALLTTPEEG